MQAQNRQLILDKPAGDDGANAADGMAGLTKDQRDLIAAGNVLLDTLFKEQEHFGKTSEEIELMRLKTEGLGDVSDDLVGSIEDQIAAVKRLKDAREEEKKIQEDELKRAEKFAALVNKATDEQLRAEGIIGEDTIQNGNIRDEFKKLGATPEQLEDVTRQLNSIASSKRLLEERMELEKEAARISDRIKTPGEMLGEDFINIQKALDAGLLSNEEAKLASDEATEDFNKDFRRKGREERTNIAGGALERGSAEAFSAILRAGDKGKNEQTELQKQELEIAKQMLAALKEGAAPPINVVENAF
jgi:hypothetical protein